VADAFVHGRLPWRIAFAVLLLLVIVGSLLPSDVASRGSAVPDWAQHGISYGLLMATLLAGQASRRYLASAAALMFLGCSLEVIQGCLGYRAAQWSDVLADAVGIAAVGLGIALGARLTSRRRRAVVSEPEG
jgi:VanZ family protein